jgi:hypothetical protein
MHPSGIPVGCRNSFNGGVVEIAISYQIRKLFKQDFGDHALLDKIQLKELNIFH